MTVRNYYLLSEDELLKQAEIVRNWLFDYPKHLYRRKALVAMSVINSAYELERDDFVNLIIDSLT